MFGSIVQSDVSGTIEAHTGHMYVKRKLHRVLQRRDGAHDGIRNSVTYFRLPGCL